jgi:ABC-type lipoprotein export system ATPase subunit
MQIALHDLCLAIRHGERCGILGKNGAGKTTCLSILTNQIAPTAGEVLVHGRSISGQPSQSTGAGSQLGYCPQIDPLLDMMSAQEQLSMYARLKGVPPQRLQAAVRDVLCRVSLPEEMSRRPSIQYSGGSKRKLSLAIALVGGVSAILLDEPSSGMVSAPHSFCTRFRFERVNLGESQSIWTVPHAPWNWLPHVQPRIRHSVCTPPPPCSTHCVPWLQCGSSLGFLLGGRQPRVHHSS